MREAFDYALSCMEEAELIVVEAAHIYANQEPDAEQITGARIAADFIKGVGRPVETMLFIDNFNVEAVTLNYERYLELLRDHGFSVNNVVFEADLIPDAYGLLERLKAHIPGKKLVPKHTNLTPNNPASFWTNVGKVPLINSVGRPSCALLDASLYLRKTVKPEVAALTILPESYRPQQMATAAVLRASQTNLSAVNLFFNCQTGVVKPYHLMSKTIA